MSANAQVFCDNKALARAFRWKRMLESGEFTTIAELAGREGIAPSYMIRVLRLTLIAPDTVEAILHGRQGPEVTLTRLLEPFPDEWESQRKCRFDRDTPESIGRVKAVSQSRLRKTVLRGTSASRLSCSQDGNASQSLRGPCSSISPSSSARRSAMSPYQTRRHRAAVGFDEEIDIQPRIGDADVDPAFSPISQRQALLLVSGR
jgi:hypothetical protein